MRRTKSISLVLTLALVLCLSSQAGCDKNKIHEAAKASDRMATLIGALIDLKRDLGQTGTITPQEELALTEKLLEANTRVKQFNEFARKQTADTPAVRLELASTFNTVIVAINKLSEQAIFPVKNPDAKKKLLAVLNSINVSLQIIDAALKG